LVFTTDWRLASTDRNALIIRPSAYVAGKKQLVSQALPVQESRFFQLPELPLAQSRAAKGSFGRSLRLRQVTAAGCGACEADLNVLSTVVFDLSRFGMDFVASPRHADALVLTGPVPRNMQKALDKCHAAMSSPKLVIAVGACAISGGLFKAAPDAFSEQEAEGARPHLPVDLYIPGCPPHPFTSLDALLRLTGRAVPGME
jgi:Ni,Fe-hydrogenase III small subunit